jgi:hypothetical protein
MMSDPISAKQAPKAVINLLATSEYHIFFNTKVLDAKLKFARLLQKLIFYDPRIPQAVIGTHKKIECRITANAALHGGHGARLSGVVVKNAELKEGIRRVING